ncbi:phenylacetate--CoA ligase family protein [Rhabdochromatium marinum]|uniref:phenylacetate--CoA ligase family protein n=1 Tax=Rhabdochromatium marinum TaxID=48729 RepID=UPI0019031F30|nr:phenylacetate--CoA ligase family protein [Rhabdochromatium marinum]
MKKHMRYLLRRVLRENCLAESRARSLIKREKSNRRESERLQEVYLHRSLSRAVHVIPAYSSLIGKIPSKSVKQFVIDNFPIIDKTRLLSDRASFFPHDGIARPWWSVGRTSGTSGTPVDIFRDYNSAIWEHAFHLQHWSWAGFEKNARQIVLRGDLVVPPEQDRPPYWYLDPFGRQLILSTRHINNASIGYFAAAINAYGATQLRAYPSAAYELSRLAESHDLSLRFKSIITGSETLFPAHRDEITRVLGGPVFDFYGMAERVAFGGECEFGRMHIHPEYSFVEIVDSHGKPTEEEGFIVGTSFHNLAMPLIRYRLDDSAKWSRTACPCGRSYPTVERILGRIGDTLLDLDGRPVSPTIITFAFKGVSNLARSQVAQTERDHWEIRVVPTASYSDQDGDMLVQNMKRLVSSRLNISLKLVPSIENLPSGKYKWISQEV